MGYLKRKRLLAIFLICIKTWNLYIEIKNFEQKDIFVDIRTREIIEYKNIDENAYKDYRSADKTKKKSDTIYMHNSIILQNKEFFKGR